MLKSKFLKQATRLACFCLAALLAACAQTNNGNSQLTDGDSQQTDTVGNTPTEANAESQNSQVISVNSALQFFNAIGDNRTIIIEDDLLDLVESLQFLCDDYKVPKAVTNRQGRVVKEQTSQLVNSCNYDYEPAIVNVKNLTINGSTPTTHLQCSKRHIAVLSFFYCENITLENLVLGHVESNDCEASVVNIFDSENVTINNCKLYGCGYEGITSKDNKNLSVNGTEIYHCTSNIMTLENTQNASFENCHFYNNYGTIEISDYDKNSENILFNNCQIEDPYFNIERYPKNIFSFKNCDIDTTPRDEDNEHYGDEEEDEEPEWDSSCFDNIDKAQPRKIIHVNNSIEFIKAIGNNKTIIVDNDLTDLTETIDKMAAANTIRKIELDDDDYPAAGQEGVYYIEEYDGKGLHIVNVYNLVIKGAKQDTHIQVTPRYVNVIGFDKCFNVSLESLKMGHTEAGGCVGAQLQRIRHRQLQTLRLRRHRNQRNQRRLPLRLEQRNIPMQHSRPLLRRDRQGHTLQKMQHAQQQLLLGRHLPQQGHRLRQLQLTFQIREKIHARGHQDHQLRFHLRHATRG